MQEDLIPKPKNSQNESEEGGEVLLEEKRIENFFLSLSPTSRLICYLIFLILGVLMYAWSVALYFQWHSIGNSLFFIMANFISLCFLQASTLWQLEEKDNLVAN